MGKNDKKILNLNSTFQSFFIFFVILTVLFVLIAESSYFKINHSFWNLSISTILGLYLIFLFIRSGIHLVLSFLWVVFKDPISKLERFPLVTILIPCYNEEKIVSNLIQSLFKISYPNLEILIIDDGSKDKTFDLALKELNKFEPGTTEYIQAKKIKVLHKINGGKASALNFGIERSSGEFIYCCDADSYIQPNSIEIGVSRFLKFPRLAAVAGNIRIGNHKNILTRFQHLEYVSALNFLKLAQSFLGFVSVIPGPAGLFKKSVLQEIGGYQSDTFAEDCDLTIKILMKGYVCIYEPRMITVTEAPEDFESLVKQRYRWSRGVLQALKVNIDWLFRPNENIRNFFIIGYLLFETLLMPICNYVFFLISIFYAVNYGFNDVTIFYFGQLTVLDIVLTFYAISAEKNPVILVVLSVFNRVTYSLSMEIIRFFSMIEEVLNIPMDWGKLKRKGVTVNL